MITAETEVKSSQHDHVLELKLFDIPLFFGIQKQQLLIACCSLLLVNSLSVISWNHIQFSVEGKSISLYHIIPTFAGLLVVIDGDDLVHFFGE